MTVYLLAPDYSFPSGGVRVLYRHVDILNRNGIKAYILHRKQGFRCDWFENSTPVAYVDSQWVTRLRRKVKALLRGRSREVRLVNAGKAFIEKEDIVGLPEINGPNAMSFAPGVAKVIVNQGAYLTFRGFPSDGRRVVASPYDHSDLVGVLTNSDDSEAYLRYAFPEVPLRRFRPHVDERRFRLGRVKEKQICFTPKKNENVVRQVINLLQLRGALDGFDLVPFAGVKQAEVARIMGESAFFLAFSEYEGFGLPAAEAMASGCVVIGFHGGGGREFFRPEFSYPVPSGDVVGFARTVERVLAEYRENPAPFEAKGRMASEYIRAHYTAEAEEEDVMSAWREFLAR